MVITEAGFAVLESTRDLVLSRWVERDRSLDAYDWRIRQVFAPMIPKGGTVIDCGAFLGSHTTVYAKAVGSTGRVVAFEPSPKHVECLRYNTRHLPQVHIVPVALYSERSSVWLAPNHFNAGMSVIGEPDDVGAIEVEATRLDAYEIGFGRVDFIKIDVEGLVLRVLEGAVETLGQYRPMVVAEVGDNLNLFGDTTEDVIAFMQRHGYVLRELPSIDGADHEDQRDVLFTPREAGV